MGSKKRVKRNGGAGRRQKIDLELSYKIYKAYELECLNGNFMTIERLREFIELFLRQQVNILMEILDDTCHNCVTDHIIYFRNGE